MSGIVFFEESQLFESIAHARLSLLSGSGEASSRS